MWLLLLVVVVAVVVVAAREQPGAARKSQVRKQPGRPGSSQDARSARGQTKSSQGAPREQPGAERAGQE